MRILATVAFSFGAAVFMAIYLLSGQLQMIAGVVFALACVPVFLWRKRRQSRAALRVLLILAGLSAGLLWTSLHSVLFFAPARDLDDKTVILKAQVSDWPQPTDYGWSVLIRAETDSFAKVNMILYSDGQGADLRPGDKISTVAHCTLGDRTFAGEEITYYVAKGIYLRGVAYGRLDVERPEHIPVQYWAAVLARELKQSISAVFPEKEAALIRALVTGNRDHLTDEFTTSLQRTGLSHTVAVSGMHLALSASMFSLLLGRGKRSTALLTILWTLIFCAMAGNTPSVVRASVMIILLQIAPLLERERDGATSLAVALMLLLAWNPFSAAHVGLQLSFGAVAGIFLVSDDIQLWILKKMRLDKRPGSKALRVLIAVPRFLIATLAATLGASVFTVPLVALHFQSISLISPLSNLLTLWAVAALFTGGLVLGMAGIVFNEGVALLAAPFVWLADYLEWIVDLLARVPLAAVSLESFYYKAWVVFLCVLICVLLASRGKVRPVFPVAGAGVAFAACVLFTALSFQSGELTAAVLDVGQGQSVLIRAGNYLTLVDCGGDGQDNAGDVAADYIQSLGRNRLDLLVVSHCHSDHANGIPQLMRRVQIDAVALPNVSEDDPLRKEIMELAEEEDCEIWLIEEDTHISLGEEQEFMLFAPLGQHADPNEQGLTVLAASGDFEVLLTGDMGGAVEQLLLEHADLPDVELLVVGHHGSRYSTTAELLEEIRPDAAVISVGADNRYGHPAAETLERLEACGADIFRTDLQGTVVIRSDET